MSVAAHQPSSFLPHPETPVIDPGSVSQAQRHLIPRYGGHEWPIAPMSQNPSVASQNIIWDRVPDGLRESLRSAAWVMFRRALPEALVAAHNNRMVTRPSVALAFHTVVAWRDFAIWADHQGIKNLPDVRAADMADYVRQNLKRGLARDTVKGPLVALSRLHYYSTLHLPAEHHLAAPPWLAGRIDDYLPTGSSGGENTTDAISPDTIGPLLIWALRFVEDFADDILTAFAEQQQLRDATHARTEADAGPDAFTRIEEFLDDLRQRGQPVPSRSRNGGREQHHPSLFVASVTGTLVSQALTVFQRRHWAKAAAANPGPCWLSTPATATIDGTTPWQPGFDFYSIDALHRHLVAACFVVIAYLTGMRPAEVLALRSGCCPEPETASAGPRRYLINGRVFKNARDDDGVHLSAGRDRGTPWVAIPPVVRAIRIMERIVGDGDLLFARDADKASAPNPGRSLTHTTAAHRIDKFITWVNEYAQANDRPAEAIPPDPSGGIGISRFRRTLAWHIARRPGGLAALAVQYGHLRTLVSEGYASRSRDGLHRLIDVETARDIAERLSNLNEAIEDDEGISGPAARRLMDAATRAHHRFAGIITTHRQARALLDDPGLVVFEIQRAFLLCNYAREKALCNPGRATTDAPSLDRCQPRCANIARTDHHATRMLQHASRLRAQTGAMPTPLADRLRAEADALTARAQQHFDGRINDRETP